MENGPAPYMLMWRKNPVALVLEEQHWSYLVLPFLHGTVGWQPLESVGTAKSMHNFHFLDAVAAVINGEQTGMFQDIFVASWSKLVCIFKVPGKTIE